MSTANLFKRGGSADASVFTSGDPVSDPVALFLVQAALVIIISRTLGAALKRWKVPRVAAEVLTGILLGQTLLWLAPGVQTHLFPPESLALLHIAAEFGLILFFFLVCNNCYDKIV